MTDQDEAGATGAAQRRIDTLHGTFEALDKNPAIAWFAIAVATEARIPIPGWANDCLYSFSMSVLIEGLEWMFAPHDWEPPKAEKWHRRLLRGAGLSAPRGKGSPFQTLRARQDEFYELQVVEAIQNSLDGASERSVTNLLAEGVPTDPVDSTKGLMPAFQRQTAEVLRKRLRKTRKRRGKAEAIGDLNRITREMLKRGLISKEQATEILGPE